MRPLILGLLSSTLASYSDEQMIVDLDDLLNDPNFGIPLENHSDYIVFVPTVYPQDIVLETEFDHWGLHGIVGGLENVPRDRFYILEMDSTEVVLSTTYANYLNDILLPPAHGTGQPVRISRSGSYIPDHWRQYHDCIGIGFGSDFAESVGSVFISPIQIGVFGTKLRFVVGPSDPQLHCLDRQLATIPISLDTSNRFQLPIEVSLIDAQNTSPILMSPERFESVEDHFSIQISFKKTRLPLLVRQTLREIIDQRFGGQEIDEVIGEHWFASDCTRMISELPSISLTIRNDNQLPVYQIILTAEDYASVDAESGRCIVHLDLNEDTPNMRSMLGIQFLERVGIFYDYTNRQIGLCDPL